MNKWMRFFLALYAYLTAVVAFAGDVESLLSLLATEPVIKVYDTYKSAGILLNSDSKTTIRRIMKLMKQSGYESAFLKMNAQVGFRSLYFIRHEQLMSQGLKKILPHCLITLEKDQKKWVIDVNMVELSGVDAPFMGTEAAWLEKLTEISEGKVLRKKSSLVFYRDYSSFDAIFAAEAEPVVDLVKSSINWVRKPFWYKVWHAKYKTIGSRSMNYWQRIRTQCSL
tara:strand:+ start:6537 stop:7211 length:675 start_codon:yes stop_codon:yes gene_type:complete